MSNFLHTKILRAVLALVTLALLSLPFAHRAGSAPLSPEMAQFLAMGGTLSDICGETFGHINGGCESCTIVAAMLVPPAVQLLRPTLTPSLLDIHFDEPITVRLPASRTPHPVRAPPFS